MLLVALDVDSRSRVMAVGLVLPFAFLSLTPVNAIEFFPTPSADGLGLYNRQSGFPLYVLVAAFVCMRQGWRRDLALMLSVLALFGLKINAFLPAVVLMLYGLVAGSLSLRSFAIVLGVPLAVVLAVGLPTGMLMAYLTDISDTVEHNRGATLGRLITALSVKFNVIVPLALLTLALLWVGRAALWLRWRGMLGGGNR